MGMIKGLEIELGGEIRTVPPLNLNAVEELEDDIIALNGSPTLRDQMRISRKIVHAALVRNYPELTVAQVGDWLDLGNVGSVVNAILGKSGFAASADGASEGGPAKK